MAKKKNSVQALIGLECFTDKAQIVFFSVEPTNISVLSAANIDVKIHHLMMAFSMIPNLEIIAADSAEYFDSNKAYIRRRLTEETNPAVRKLLNADIDFLDEIQIGMSSARQFMFAVRFRREKPEQIFAAVNRIDKVISEHGFIVKRMTVQDVKRTLSIYFGASICGESIPDIEGEEYFELGVKK